MQSNDDDSVASDLLKAAVVRVCAPDSYYWLFRNTEGLQLDAEHEIEVRLDIDPQCVSAFVAPIGWSVVHTRIERGFVFLRRKQPLTDEAVKAMFAEVLAMAVAHHGRFHSWVHGSSLRKR
jgi:hypothetical protein